MSYTARVFKVMIASPADVVKERQLARDVIDEWNAINAEHRGIIMLPIGWETHSVPEIGDRPQEILNRQILQDCDILIAAFWTRLGTPTGLAESGTVEEIEEHLAVGKPAMIYFSSQPVAPESIDADQYKRLRDFRTAFEKRGLIERYDSLSEFRAKLTRQLAQIAIKELAGESAAQPDGPENLQGTRSHLPQLSPLGMEMLRAAALDPSGDIINLATMGGRSIQTSRREFTKLGDPRSEAAALAALEELERIGLIRDRGYKREIFTVTDSGFKVADSAIETNS